MKNFLGKFSWKSVGIVEFESDSSRKNSFPRFLQPGNLIVQKFDALCKCGGKAIFLHAYDTLDVILFCQNLTEVLRIAEDRNNGINCTVEEGLCDSEHTSMTDRTAKRATENVPAPLVRRQNSIHNHDGDGACMVRNHLMGNVLFRIFPIRHIRNLGCILDDRIEQIRLKIRSLILHNGGKAFQPAARINILVCEKIVLAFLRAVILRKDEIPNLKEAVTVAADAAGRFSAATIFAEINVDLRVRPTGTGTDLPEVVLQCDDMIRRHVGL